MTEKNIVVGVDGSAGSYAALGWAAKEASIAQRPLQIVHCDDRAARALLAEAVTARQEEYSRAEDVLDEASALERRRYPDLSIRTTIVPEPPARGLLQVSTDAEMLVVGAHGAHTKGALLLGSSAMDVAAHATCPTVIVRPSGVPSGRYDGQVIAGVDGSEPSRKALRFAFEAAARRNLRLTAIHVDEAQTSWQRFHSTHVAPRVRIASLTRDDLLELVQPLAIEYPQVRVDTEVLAERAVTGLRNATAGAALLVIGDTGRTAAASALLGSVAVVLLQRAYCPVAVVHT